MVLAQTQTYRSTDQNREPRNKSKQLQLINLDKRANNIQWGKDSILSKQCKKAKQLHVN